MRRLLAFAIALAAVVAFATPAMAEKVDVVDAPDVIAFMDVDATKAQIADVRGFVDRARSVEAFAQVGRRATRDEIAEMFADEPHLVATIAAAKLPVSFRMTIPDKRQITKLTGQLLALQGVEAVSTPSTGQPPTSIYCDEYRDFADQGFATFRVYMAGGAPPASVDAVTALLEKTNTVDRFAYTDGPTALREARELLGDQEYLDLPPELAPSWFDVWVSDDDDALDLRLEVGTMDDVTDTSPGPDLDPALLTLCLAEASET